MTLFGLPNGIQIFGLIPPWVSNPQKQLPGTAEIKPRGTLTATILALMNGSVIWDTENLLWFVMSILVSICFPLPQTTSDTFFSFDFFISRFALWSTIMFVYVGFFYLALYEWNWSSRPFVPNRSKTVVHRKLLHNIAFSLGGIAIWCFMENVVCFLWSTNRLETLRSSSVNNTSSIPSLVEMMSFVSSPSSSTWFSSATPNQHHHSEQLTISCHLFNMIKIIVGFPLALIIKDFHFYFVHRLIHFGPFYNFIHSLHHRNADPEPFAGISMHPIEHVLYQSSALLPILLFPRYIHNSAFTWIGLHLLISPALAHSSYEDHWQMGEAFHYYHHRFFDVNFAGGGVTYLDEWFGSGYFGPKNDKQGGGKNKSKSKNKKENKNNSVRRSISSRCSTSGGDEASENDEHDIQGETRSLTRHLDDMNAKRFGEVLARAPLDEKASINPFSGLSKDGMISPFMLASILCWIPWVMKSLRLATNSTTTSRQASILAGAGPLICAIILDVLSNGAAATFLVNNPQKLLLLLSRPFGAKRPVWETVLHFVVGISMSVIPVCIILYRVVA